MRWPNKDKEPLVAAVRRNKQALEVELLKHIRQFEMMNGVSIDSIGMSKLGEYHKELGFTQRVSVWIKLL